MGFSQTVKKDAMVACGRHCCICHKFCGLKMESHHIKPRSEGGSDLYENAIPLCLECHADMRTYDSKHPKGIKYSETELIQHRDSWYAKIKDNQGVPAGEQANDLDKVIYRKLITILPWEGSISFIKRNNFAGFSFDLRYLDELHEFEYLCKHPAFEFIDSDLEGLRAQLFSQCDNFTTLVVTYTFPCNGSEHRNSVPSDWELKCPDHFNKVVKDIHSAAAKVCETYEMIIRTGKIKLGILPENMS